MNAKTSWREVATPHQDVLRGGFQEAEFAVDLSKVQEGKVPPEYQDPVQFFHRTYLTEGMHLLLESVLRRLNGKGGDPSYRGHSPTIPITWRSRSFNETTDPALWRIVAGVDNMIKYVLLSNDIVAMQEPGDTTEGVQEMKRIHDTRPSRIGYMLLR